MTREERFCLCVWTWRFCFVLLFDGCGEEEMLLQTEKFAVVQTKMFRGARVYYIIAFK